MIFASQSADVNSTSTSFADLQRSLLVGYREISVHLYSSRGTPSSGFSSSPGMTVSRWYPASLAPNLECYLLVAFLLVPSMLHHDALSAVTMFDRGLTYASYSSSLNNRKLDDPRLLYIFNMFSIQRDLLSPRGPCHLMTELSGPWTE